MKTFLHILRLCAFALGVTLLLALFTLLVTGLPPALTQRLCSRLRDAGFPLQVDSVRFSTHRGLVLGNARLYSTSPDDLQPLLNAKKMYILPWPVNWTSPLTDGWHIKLYVRDLGVSLGRAWEETLPPNHSARSIRRVDAVLTVTSEDVTVETARLDWSGFSVTAAGTAEFGEAAPGFSAPETPEPGRFGKRAAKTARSLTRLTFQKPPELNLQFEFSSKNPARNRLEARLEADGITWQDQIYTRLLGDLHYLNETVTLNRLELDGSADQSLQLSGTVNLSDTTARFSLQNSLSVSELLNLLPNDQQADLARTGVIPFGALRFSASAGPAPLETLADQISLQIEQAQLRWNELTLDPLALRFTRNGPLLDATEIRLKINGEPISGRLSMNLDSGAWEARVQAQCDPMLPAMYDQDLHDFLKRMRFLAEHPKGDLILSQSAAGEPLQMRGTLSADHFTCGGVPLEHLQTVMVYSNSVLRLDPLHIDRADATFDGGVQIDFNQGLAFFNVTNSFPPADIARALAPEVPALLEEFRFSGPLLAVGSGQLDYWSWTNHNFSGTFRAANAGYGWLDVTGFESQVRGEASFLIFTNTSLRLYGGRAEGNGSFDLVPSDGTAPYRLAIRSEEIRMQDLLAAASSNEYRRIRGDLSCQATLSADAAAGFWQSATGQGKAAIRNGHLADIPLFGGFSRLLQSVFAGFNLFSLTTFSTDFQLQEGALRSDNVQLGGSLLSANGRGSYSPAGGLDFIVTAVPLRQSESDDRELSQLQRLALGALRSGTAPLSRLLEFRLEGPLEKPKWRFVNLPDELSRLLYRPKEPDFSPAE